MSAGCGDHDGSPAVQELAAMVADAEAFYEREGRREPLDCCAHVGIVKNGNDSSVWCRAVLLQHGSDITSVNSATRSDDGRPQPDRQFFAR